MFPQSSKIRSAHLQPVGVILVSWLSPARSNAAETAMQSYVAAMHPGWNLGNTLDAIPTETSWGNPLVTQAFIQQIADQGFKSIRIPVTWTDHTGPAPTHAIDPARMNRVQQFVDRSLDAGLHVIINLHHDSRQGASATPTTRHSAVRARYDALWSQIGAEPRNSTRRGLPRPLIRG